MISGLFSKIRRTFLDEKFFKYAIIGLSGVTIDFIIYALLVKFAHFSPVIASIVSVSIAILNNFLWNALLNFKKKDRILRRFIKFYLTGCTGLVLTVIIVFVLHNLIGLGPMLAKIISIPPVVALQFILNKKFTFKDKSSLEDIKKILLSSLPYILTGIFLIILIAILMANVIYLVPTGVNIVTISKQPQSWINGLFVAGFVIVVLLFIWLNLRGPMKSLKTNTLIKICLVLVAIMGLMVICLMQFKAQVPDVTAIDKAAAGVIQGKVESDGYAYGFSMANKYTGDKYFLAFPYQLGLLSAAISIYSIFGLHNTLPFQLLVLLFVVLLVWSICQITKILFNKDIVTKIAALLGAAYLPIILYAVWMYGDIISLSLGVTSIYLLLSYYQIKEANFSKKQFTKITLSILSMAVAVAVKPTMLIFIIGLGIFFLLRWLSGKQKIILPSLVVCLMFVVQFLINQGIMTVFERKLDVKFDNPIPKVAFIAMGLQKDSFYTDDLYNFGRINNYTWAAYEHSGFDTKKTSEMASDKLSSQIEEYWNNPKEAAWFFGNKFVLFWADPDFMSLYSSTGSIREDVNSGHSQNYSKIQRSIIPDYKGNYGVVGYSLQSFMFAHKMTVIIGAIIFCFMLIGKKIKDNFILLLPIIFITGIGVYMLWECNPRYMIPFFTILIPLSSYGLYVLYSWIDKNILSQHPTEK